MSSGDDGIHADNALTIFDGTLVIPACYEGLEGTTITVSGGETTLTASDDGINAAGGADGSGFFGFGGGMDIFASDGVSSVTVSGGVLRIDAGGDGIDSNGDLHISGGSIYVDGPTDGANGALDYAGDAVITGGTLLAIGSSQMAENVSASSTQGTAMVTLAQSQGASSAIVLTDTDGKTLLEYTAKNPYNCVIVSTPGLLVGGPYTLATGDLETEIVMESTVYGSGGFGGMMPGKQQGGMNGGFGGRGNRGDTGGMNPGEVPDFNEIPGIDTDENGNAVIPEMPEGGFGDFGGGQMPGGAFPGGEMPSGDIPEGMTPPDMGGMPQGGFGGGIPPEMPT